MKNHMTIKAVQNLLCNLFNKGPFSIRPLNNDSSQTNPCGPKAFAGGNTGPQKFAVSGKIGVPHRDSPQTVQMEGTIALNLYGAGQLEIVGFEGVTALGTWDLAEGIVLSKTQLRFFNKNGQAAVLLSGALRLADDGAIETGGALNAEIHHSSEDPDRMYIGTLLTEAYLNIGSALHFCGSTIRFELCTKPHENTRPLPYFIDEMDELLIQCSEALPLASWRISCIGEKPLTLSIGVNALKPGFVQTTLSVFPARLRIPFLSENSCLFVADREGDGSFTINIKGEWGSFISASPNFCLISPANPGGPSLIEGASFLTGRLDAKGLSQATISLSSELIKATAFPSSKWPQKLPDQKISFSISDPGDVRLILKFNPLSIDGFLIESQGGNDEPLEGALCKKGLKFKKGYLVSHESSEQHRELPALMIDNLCQVWVELKTGLMELEQWFRKF
jgi:hypothetical protein